VNSTPSDDELVGRARDLIPLLKANAVEAEDLRRMPDANVAALRDAGLHTYFTPARYGGWEMDWPVQHRIGRELAKGCGSTAWVATVVIGHTWLVGRLPQSVQDAVWADGPDAIITTGVADGSTLEPVDGGYRVKGTWKFCSGIDHADWAMFGGELREPGAPKDAPPTRRVALLHRSEVEILDNWYAAGLKGTGSGEVRADVVVPAERTAVQMPEGGDTPGAALHKGYIYGVEMLPYFRTALLGPILGAAQGALDDYIDLTRDRVAQMGGQSVARLTHVQTRLAESSADIHSVELLARELIDLLHRRGAAGERLQGAERLLVPRNLSYLSRLARGAVDRLAQMMGAHGQTGHNPVQRHLRDISAMAAHGSLQWEASLSPYGKWALGVETGDAEVDASPRGASDNL